MRRVDFSLELLGFLVCKISKLRRLPGTVRTIFPLVVLFLLVVRSQNVSHLSNLSRERTKPNMDETEWLKYRISDGIHRYPGAPGCNEFPGSLVCLYQKNTASKGDLRTLMRVLDSVSHTTPIIVGGDAVVVHIRLGDGLCAQIDNECRGNISTVPNCWENDQDCWRDPVSKQRYAFSRKWYIPVTQQLLPHRTVIIVGDAKHWTRGGGDPRNGDFSVDELYRQNVADFFASHGHTTQIRAANLPDNDFIFMTQAKTFVQGGGGLSRLIGSVVEARGGTVIKPTMISLP